jgi:hypothetical protein
MKRMPETLSRRVAGLLPRLLVKFFCNGPPINTTIPQSPTLRFDRSFPTMGLPAGPSSPSRSVLSIAYQGIFMFYIKPGPTNPLPKHVG